MKISKAILALLAAVAILPSCNSKSVQTFADIDLVGAWHREPYEWSAERFAPHVSYTDAEGRENWLFEAYLFTEGTDAIRNRNLSISPSGKSAGKESWAGQLDLWLSPGGAVSNLDKACEAVAARIGAPSRKRQVVIAIPDPIMFEVFSDRTSSTKYWGEVDGKELDFASVEDRIKACRWYIDEARKMFRALKCKYLELGGFYILSEEIYLPYAEDPADRLNWQYKNWETIVPALADYCHRRGEGLYWIPYHLAPGYEYWKKLGFDMAWMQPNWYWDLNNPGKHPFDRTIAAIKESGMGMETEFEYSMVENEMGEGKAGPDAFGKLVYTGKDVPALRERFRDYMRHFRESGLYGSASLAIYTGSDALTQLASSPLDGDREMYREFCEFILGNPMRKEIHSAAKQPRYDNKGVVLDSDGNLVALRGHGGHNFAAGRSLWRMYYNTLEEKEIQIEGSRQHPEITVSGDTIRLEYDGLRSRGRMLNIKFCLTIVSTGEEVRFGASLENHEPHTIVRELQYPLVGGLQLPEGYRLLTTHTGGQIFDDPLGKIVNVPAQTLYMKPDQKFRQYDLQYPRNAASNCFAFVGEKDGIYFGSHDTSLQQTWHGLRAYPSAPGRFDILEAGFYRYPNAMYGDSWINDASVARPYKGDWTETSRIYRAWADTWWHHDPVPSWVKNMTGWQRIIFKHQYGEYLRHYSDLPGRIFEAGKNAGSDAVLAFGWWKEGMDNGYPDYTPDDSEGGDEGWKKAIAEYRAKGGHLILYFNGRLIDNSSRFYRSGQGSKVSNHDNTGDEFTEHYKFTGEGTTLGYYDSRTFVVADMSNRLWRDKLISWADRAMSLGANSVFYDQLGVAEEFPQWNLSREFPVPDIFTGRYKADALKEIRDHVKARDPEFCLGTEWLSDCTSQFCDFVHIVEFTALPESFPEWFRYTFPEIVWSDRCVRDEVDMERRVGNTLLKGLRNDIEVYRCRGLIDETPHYQEYLGKVNEIRHAYPEMLLEGRFAFMDDISVTDDIVAREFDGGDKIAVVVTSLEENGSEGTVKAEGRNYLESKTIGAAIVSGSGPSVKLSLGQYGIAVLVFGK